MNITLERILSLIPRKPDGGFVHGAKAEFARNIGFSGGEVVTMWINGTSQSYNNYLYEIAAKYGVSVAWLRGETDEKSPPQAAEPEDELREYLEMLRSRPECRMLLSTVKGATKEEVEANVKLIEALRGFRG